MFVKLFFVIFICASTTSAAGWFTNLMTTVDSMFEGKRIACKPMKSDAKPTSATSFSCRMMLVTLHDLAVPRSPYGQLFEVMFNPNGSRNDLSDAHNTLPFTPHEQMPKEEADTRLELCSALLKYEGVKTRCCEYMALMCPDYLVTPQGNSRRTDNPLVPLGSGKNVFGNLVADMVTFGEGVHTVFGNGNQ